MRKSLALTFLFSCALTASVVQEAPVDLALAPPVTPPEFSYLTPVGEVASVPLADESAKHKLTLPPPAPGVNPQLMRAATIAEERANAHSRSQCWHYVKDALVASGAVRSRPETEFAKQAGDELVRKFGFQKLDISDPYAAPVGAVLVYDAKGAPGHVEIRTANGFASDFRTKTPSRRPLLGVFVKA